MNPRFRCVYIHMVGWVCPSAQTLPYIFTHHIHTYVYKQIHSYLPVPTAHVYWQRLQQGSLVLDKTEGEIISQVGAYIYIHMY